MKADPADAIIYPGHRGAALFVSELHIGVQADDWCFALTCANVTQVSFYTFVHIVKLLTCTAILVVGKVVTEDIKLNSLKYPGISTPLHWEVIYVSGSYATPFSAWLSISQFVLHS